MTNLREELARLHEAATVGPWCVDMPGSTFVWHEIISTHGVADCGFGGENEEEAANATLIVALRNAVPEILEALAERDRLREADEWQPIETAPKDGTTIDVWRDGIRETVYWGFRPHECGEMGQYCDGDWHGEKEPGWVCSTFGEFVGGEHDPFTHWRPLPTPPATGGTDA